MKRISNRKFLSFVALLLVFCTVFAGSAGAAGPELDVDVPPIEPVDPLVHFQWIYATISINSAGKASCYSNVSSYDRSNQVYLTMYLQRIQNGNWTTIKYASANGTGLASLPYTRYVSPGYYYRTYVVAWIYTSSGAFVEMGSSASNAIYY